MNGEETGLYKKSWSFISKKRNLHKLNSQSNLIYPERDLNEKLISNQQENLNNLAKTKANKPKNRKTKNSTKSNNLLTVNSNSNIPSLQITTTNDKLLNPLALYQMYHQNDLKFKKENSNEILPNLDQLKLKELADQYDGERRSFSSSFGRQYVCCNLFNDNVRQIDYVIVYDVILHEYGKKFLNKSISSNIDHKSKCLTPKRNRKFDNQSDGKSEPKDDQVSQASGISNQNEKRNKFKLKNKQENQDESTKSDESSSDKALNNEIIRRLSSSNLNDELEKMEELDNNQDEEIEYLETKIIDIMHQGSPTHLNSLQRKNLKKQRQTDVFEIESNGTSSNNNLNEIISENLTGKSNRIDLQLNSKQRYLAECCKRFEENLIAEGLELEFQEARFTNTNNRRIGFLKLHCPFDILCKYAELMKLKMPMKRIETSWRMIFDEKNDPYSKGRFTAPYSKGKFHI